MDSLGMGINLRRMISGRAFSCALVLALAFGSQTLRAASKQDVEVQTLANFPALRKLAKSTSALRGYLARVSDRYRRAGYRDFARELATASPLIILFGQPERAETATGLKKARSALRGLKQALAKNSFVVLPRTGETLPDYHGLGASFLDIAAIALKNLQAHKNVANSLRNNKGTAWITGKGGNIFTASSSLGGSLVQTSFSASGAGSVTLAANSIQVLDSGYSSWNSSRGTLVLSGVLSLPKTVAFPPDVPLPDDGTYTLLDTLTDATIIGSIDLPAGTRIVTVAADFQIPDGAYAVPYGTGFTVTDLAKYGTGTLTFTGTGTYAGETKIVGGNLIFAAGFVPASFNGGLTIANNATLTIQGSAPWAIFPAAVEIPPSLAQGGPVTLNSASLINGAEYPIGTRLIKLADPAAVLPAGATLLPTPATISAAPAPTPAG